MSPNASSSAASDAGGHLELALHDADLLDEVGRRRRRRGGQLHRSGVRRRGREGAEAHHHAHPPGAGQSDDGVGEGPPVEVGLGPDQDTACRAPTRPCPWRTTVWGQVSSVVTPLTMRATGRRARWSRKCSPLNVTTGSVCPWPSSAAMAVVAPSPASTQPSRADDQDRLGAGPAPGGPRRSRSARCPGAHGAVSSASAAISARRPTCAGNASTLPWSPAPAPAT